MAPIRKVNVGSRGEVVAQLLERHKSALVKDCKKLRLDRFPSGFLPKCDISWASEEKDPKVDARMSSGWGDGYQIPWPRCPQDCPHYDKAENFETSAGRDQYPSKRPAVTPATAPALRSPEKPLTTPTSAEKGTAHWLWSNLPLNVWFAFLTVLGFAFVVGVQATRLPIVREIFSLSGGAETTARKPNVTLDLPTSPGPRAP